MEVTIVHVSKMTSMERDRLGKMDLIIFYSVNGKPPTQLTIRKENPTEAEIAEAIKADVKAVGQLVGKKITL